MKKIIYRTVFGLIAMWAGISVTQAETLSYSDLVHRLTDMEHLATLPPVGEKTELASSYDRASKYDAATDKYIEWGANGDGRGFVREEGDTVVLADIQGAGCLWRIWSAAAGHGHVKIFLDGAETPAIDLPFTDYFRPDEGPFVWPNLVYVAAGQETETTAGIPGSNNFVPISFAKSCKIVGDKAKPGNDDSGWGQYFQFTYTRFAPGTVVPTFKLPFSDEAKAALDEANQKIGRSGEDVFQNQAGQKSETTSVTVGAGETKTAFESKGAGAITALKVKLALPKDAEEQRTLLRQLTIRMTWDGETKPAVWSPLGDFFATVGGSGSFSSLPVGLLEDGTLYAYWYMPFAKGAKIEVGNDGKSPVALAVTVAQAPLTKPIATFGRFHAKWHRDAFLPDRPDRAPDWTMVTTQGRGRFVGVLLHVWNPNGDWWGEGDEKFFIDGEKFPSTIGTGSEDYFGYAWSSGSRFVRPLHGQPLAENNQGHEVDYRWHISDQVPFQTSFEGAIEKYFPNTPDHPPYDVMSLDAAIAFWYLAPGGTDPYEPIAVEQRVGYWTRPEAKYKEAGVIEGESLETVGHPAFSHWPYTSLMARSTPGIWSNDRLLTWTTDHGASADGEHMELKVPVAKAGKYKLQARFAKGPIGGTYQLSVDGQKLKDLVDLYSEKMTPSDVMDLGTFDLTAGEHVLGVLVLQKNAAIPGNGLNFSLDYLKLVPVP